MRVQFSYDQEEMVDATMRVLRRSKTFRSVGWQGMIFATLFCLLGIYVVFMVLLQNPYLAVITAVVSTLTNVVLLRSFHEHGAKKRLRKFFREQFGEQNSFTCDVELTPQEVRITQDRNQAVYEWTSVEEIVVTADSVDIFAKLGGIVVRDRAFESPDAREAFIAFARNYLATSHNSTNEEIRSHDA